MGKTLGIILAGAMALGASGCMSLSIDKMQDLTGDGIPDVLVNNQSISPFTNGRYLFIGQKDGTFVRAKETQDANKSSIKYFVTNDGTAYFFDGKFYKQVKQE